MKYWLLQLVANDFLCCFKSSIYIYTQYIFDGLNDRTTRACVTVLSFCISVLVRSDMNNEQKSGR